MDTRPRNARGEITGDFPEEPTTISITQRSGPPTLRYVGKVVKVLYKQARYSPCACGSGKKWKFCCGAKLVERRGKLK